MTDNERAYKISGRSCPGPKPPKPRFSTFYEIQGMGIPMKTWRGSITEEARHKPYPTKILVRGNRSPSPEEEEEETKTTTATAELVIVITPPPATAVDAVATTTVKQEPVTVERAEEEECKTPVPLLSEDMEEDDTPDAAPPSFLDDGLTSPERLKLFNDIYSAMDDYGKMLPPSPFKPHVCINAVDAEVPSLVTFEFNSQFSPS